VPERVRRLEAGEIIEPLAQFYKDEVRAIGKLGGYFVGQLYREPRLAATRRPGKRDQAHAGTQQKCGCRR